MEGTQTLASLWLWLCDVARSSEAQEPLAVHSSSGDRAGWGQGNSEAIRALPFSKTFLRRVDRELPRAVREALELLKSDPSLPPMLRTAHAVLSTASSLRFSEMAKPTGTSVGAR